MQKIAPEITSKQLIDLLEKRSKKEIDFLLVDVREPAEYAMGYIQGVDVLKPTSLFRQWAPSFLEETKNKNVIFTCRTGSRSGQIQAIFSHNGHQGAINHIGGIMSYSGEITIPKGDLYEHR